MGDQGIWFKLWDGWENDGAIAELSKEDMLHWTLLGGYLKKHGNNGMVCLSKPAKALQKKLMLPSYEEVLLVLKRMPNCVVQEKANENVTDSVTCLIIHWKNWVKYQGDSSKFRVAKWRVTNRDTDVTPKKRREEKREEEIRITPPTPSTARPIFSKPTPEEVTAYAKGLSFRLDGHSFCDFYESKGWLVGKVPMKDWRAAVRTWRRNGYSSSGATIPPPVTYRDPALDVKPEDAISPEEVRALIHTAGLGKAMP